MAINHFLNLENVDWTELEFIYIFFCSIQIHQFKKVQKSVVTIEVFNCLIVISI